MKSFVKKGSLIVGLDFDGVIVADRFPLPVLRPIGAETWIPNLQDEFRLRVILCTCRVDHYEPVECELPLKVEPRQYLQEAVNECVRQDIKLFGINWNPEFECKAIYDACHAPKPYCDIYIDDKALGTPLVQLRSEPKPCVDWNIVGKMLYDRCVQHSMK